MKFRFPSGPAAILNAGAPTAPVQGRSQLRAPIQQLADSNIIGILFSKSDGPIVDANDEFLRMVGYSREDLEAGRLNWINMTPSEWGFATRLALKQMEDTGKALPFEKELIRKDGTRVPILIGIVAVSQPDLEGLCFVVDLTERKQVERDLDRLMIERFAMLDSVGDGIYGLDLEGRCTFVNAAAVRMLGYSSEECQGRNMDDLVQSKRGGLTCAVEPVPIAGGVRKREGMRSGNGALWRKDGTSFVVRYSSCPIVVNGRVDGCLVSFKDISERKKAEEILRASEERFRGAFAHAAPGMCIAGLDGRFLEVNQALCRITGYSEAELLSSSFQTITHPDDLERSVCFRDRLLRKEIPGFVAEKRYVRKDGGICWARCSVAVLADSAGAPARFTTIVEDITGQVKAQADLRLTEERYRCIVENSQEGICMCDADRSITFCNRRLKAMLGCPKGDASLQCSEIHFEEDSEDGKRRFEVRRTGVSESYETRLRRADGTPLWVNASASPVPDHQGHFAGSLCMFTDITERKRLEEQLRRAEKLEAVP